MVHILWGLVASTFLKVNISLLPTFSAKVPDDNIQNDELSRTITYAHPFAATYRKKEACVPCPSTKCQTRPSKAKFENDFKTLLDILACLQLRFCGGSLIESSQGDLLLVG